MITKPKPDRFTNHPTNKKPSGNIDNKHQPDRLTTCQSNRKTQSTLRSPIHHLIQHQEGEKVKCTIHQLFNPTQLKIKSDQNSVNPQVNSTNTLAATRHTHKLGPHRAPLTNTTPTRTSHSHRDPPTQTIPNHHTHTNNRKQASQDVHKKGTSKKHAEIGNAHNSIVGVGGQGKLLVRVEVLVQKICKNTRKSSRNQQTTPLKFAQASNRHHQPPPPPPLKNHPEKREPNKMKSACTPLAFLPISK